LPLSKYGSFLKHLPTCRFWLQLYLFFTRNYFITICDYSHS